MDRFNTFKLFIEMHRNKIIISFIFLFSLIMSTTFFLNIDNKVNMKKTSKTFAHLNIKEENKNEEIINNSKEYYFVDIKGEVRVPGVYSLEKGKRVIDAINIAGGLNENADTTLLNQSIKLTDQMVIIVYSKEKVNNINLLKEENGVKKEICTEEVKNDACFCNNVDNVVVPNLEENKESESAQNLNLNDNKININTSSLDTLKSLPYIGESKASAIIEYREKNGSFKNIEEIKNVKGIGSSLFEKIKDYITI